MANKKYFWLRLKKDFFKRHDIRIIEDMENGKDCILFYLKLLVESVDHEGCLRFSDTIPYNDKMLATLTNTNIDIVRSAINVFKELGMIELMDDETIYMSKVEKMIGSCVGDEQTRESTRLRVQRYRENQKSLQKRYSNDTCNGELEKELHIDTYKRESKERKNLPPSLEEVKKYVSDNNLNIDSEHFFAYYQSKGWKIRGEAIEDWQSAVVNWAHRDKEFSQSKKVTQFNQFEHNKYDFENLEKQILSN